MKKYHQIKIIGAICIALLLSQKSLNAQFWNQNPSPIPGAFTNFLGTDIGNPLGKRDIRFGTIGQERMRLIGEPGFNIGFLGIGLTAPAYRLDVQDNININTTGFGNGFRINGFTVLQIPGLENTFVGRGTGTGDLFCTEGISTVPNVWSMFTGATSATTSEKGAFFTGSFNNLTPNDFCMRASTTGAGGGDLVFYTQNNLERMRIKGGSGITQTRFSLS